MAAGRPEGLDVARGLAVVSMLVARLSPVGGVLDVTEYLTAPLFAVIVGISMGGQLAERRSSSCCPTSASSSSCSRRRPALGRGTADGSAPYSGTTAEVVGATFLATAAVVACVLAVPVLRRLGAGALLEPLLSTGRLALTGYTLQILFLAATTSGRARSGAGPRSLWRMPALCATMDPARPTASPPGGGLR